MKYFAALAVLILATITAHAMGFMLSVTGPYNSSCSIFVEGKPAERALALAYAQGFFAALNEGNPRSTYRSDGANSTRTSCATAPINPTRTSTVGS
jgi:hypothetical protein